jgi:hypothetical protein
MMRALTVSLAIALLPVLGCLSNEQPPATSPTVSTNGPDAAALPAVKANAPDMAALPIVNSNAPDLVAVRPVTDTILFHELTSRCSQAARLGFRFPS